MLKNLIGIVTGGASGLGKATATKLVEEGCKITICDLPHSLGMNVVQSLMPLAPDTSFSATDIRDADEVKKMFEEVVQRHSRLDFVVNCAGIASAHKTVNFYSGKLFDLGRFQRVLDTNVVGTFNVIRYAAKHIGENKPDEDGLRGTIITMSGIEAFDGQIGQAAIAASSGALTAMTKPLARDLSDRGIRVMCISPGVFQTPPVESMPEKIKLHIGSSCTGPKRLGQPEEFAHAVKFILENRYMNGNVLKLDGGLRLFYG